MKRIQTKHGEIRLPAFAPDATRAVVRSVDAIDVKQSGIQEIMVNALHVAFRPGPSAVARLGGLHGFMGWDRPIITDSGGFQIFSLLAESSKLGSVTDRGFTYRLDKTHDKRILTPEKAIQYQFQLGADIMFCLDYCTHPSDAPERQRESVMRTIRWAARCKKEFELRIESIADEGKRPLLFAVVQGGNDRGLRRICAEELLEIGFDGFGYGGWPIEDGALLDSVHYVSELVPDSYVKHGLGIGKPESVLKAFLSGYRLFDCAIPTRDARRGRLYAPTIPIDSITPTSEDFYRYLYIADSEYKQDANPLDETCDCLCCSHYSRAYLHHLFKINDHLASRLATIHNLRFYSRFMNRLRELS